jgi:hypothetical protein
MGASRIARSQVYDFRVGRGAAGAEGRALVLAPLGSLHLVHSTATEATGASPSFVADTTRTTLPTSSPRFGQSPDGIMACSVSPGAKIWEVSNLAPPSEMSCVMDSSGQGVPVRRTKIGSESGERTDLRRSSPEAIGRARGAISRLKATRKPPIGSCCTRTMRAGTSNCVVAGGEASNGKATQTRCEGLHSSRRWTSNPSRETSIVSVTSRRMPKGPRDLIRASKRTCARGCLRNSTDAAGVCMTFIVTRETGAKDGLCTKR